MHIQFTTDKQTHQDMFGDFRPDNRLRAAEYAPDCFTVLMMDVILMSESCIIVNNYPIVRSILWIINGKYSLDAQQIQLLHQFFINQSKDLNSLGGFSHNDKYSQQHCDCLY